MSLFESLFDLGYLALILAMGLRLLLCREREAKLFGWMALLLGSGDAFHLIPRVIAHWAKGGFTAHVAALSWGEMVTAITMTLFYVIYFYYYRTRSNDRTKSKEYLILALAAIRVLLTLMPQNRWGHAESPYSWALIRNLPFLLMGLLLIFWSWQKRAEKPLGFMAQMIALSYLFYLPVVVGARFVPALGALMIPKTVAYVALVHAAYKFYLPAFNVKSLLDYALVDLILGLCAGVFYREFTKFYTYTGKTFLSSMHVHMIMLGFASMLILYLLLRGTKYSEDEFSAKFRCPLILWQSGLMLTVVMFWLHGMIQTLGNGYGKMPVAALSGIAGLGHIFLGVAMVWTVIRVRKHELK